MQKNYVRTDLAVDADFEALTGEISGAELLNETVCGCKVSSVRISDREASDVLCKPIGTYLTLELEDFIKRRENSFADAAKALSILIGRFPSISQSENFLVACLGNRAVTPDAVGPEVSDSLIVTRHLKAGSHESFASFSSVSVLRTGVLGTTGIESACSLKAMCNVVKPQCVIVVDALASSELERLCKCIQICDSGIAPGSGVGNDRQAIDHATLGVPVIAVGVPTVIDAAAFTHLAAARGLFVTPRNIDELVGSVSKLIAYGINLALHRGVTVEDIDMLIG